MKKIFTSPNAAEISLFCSMLQQERIEAFTRNENLSIASGSIPFLEAMPELWILKDEDEEAALRLLDAWRKEPAIEYEPWVCPQCGETNEGQFGACWKCGYEIDGE